MQLQVQRIDTNLPLPAYGSELASGADLMAREDVAIPAGEWRAMPTGIAIALPPGYEAQIRPRSGLAAKTGVTVLNAPGTVDADYRGEVKALLINQHPTDTAHLRRGDRIAQLVVAPVMRPELVDVEALPETGRGAGGFGSTGS
ncbi:MAG: dUTP diphosphatase [Thiohalorhabdus sp.]|uniref:dUTP diphosphatase n=1 Tax=Thiohalorhabdus sp. TaxID=3094134 RepID=UPI002FC3A602